MTELLIVRHGQSSWNADGRWQGTADPPLSAVGVGQAEAAGRALPWVPDLVVSSDLRRARQTAEVLAAAVDPVPDVAVDPSLREYDAGEWSGLRCDEIEARWPGLLARWDGGLLDRTPGGEDPAAFLGRLRAGVERLVGRVPGGHLLAVSHGRAIHVLTTALGGDGRHVDHLAGWTIRFDPEPSLGAPVALLAGGGPAAGGGTTAGSD